MQINVFDSFSRAFKHTENFLFKPFNLKKWLTLGFITLFTFSGGGGFNFNIPINSKHEDSQKAFNSQNIDWVVLKNKLMHFFNGIDAKTLALIVSLTILGVLVLLLIFMWLNAVFNFVLIDNVVKNRACIREPFSRLRPQGKSLFLWNLSILAISLLLIIIFFSIIIFGIYDYHKLHHAQSFLWIFLGIIIFIPVLIVIGVINVFSIDFIVPLMHAENIKVLKAWKDFLPNIKGNIINFILYIILKIVIAIGQAILSVFAAIASLIIIGIPTLLIIAAAGLTAFALKLTMSVSVAVLIVIFASAVLSIFIYLVNTMLMPVEIFRRVFAIDLLGQFNKKWNLLVKREE